MDEIGLPQHNATVLYEDNQGALLMAQAGQPTKCTKHIETRYFALQTWVERDLLEFKRINTTDNSADAMTKAMARTLFYCHNNHIMGRLVPSYATYITEYQASLQPSIPSSSHHIRCLAMNVFHLQKCHHSSLQGGM